MLSENDWHKDELLMAIKRLKANKSADEKGLVAELLHFASENFLDRVLESFDGLMHSPQVPVDWRKTIFNMLPKHGRAKVPAEDFVIDKSWSVNMPIWMISLDLSKPFDRVHWPSLWRALSQEGISDHMISFYKNCVRIRQGKLPEPIKAAGYLTLNGA